MQQTKSLQKLNKDNRHYPINDEIHSRDTPLFIIMLKFLIRLFMYYHYINNFSNRLFLIFSQNAINIPAVCQDSSPDTPQPAYPEAAKQGWINGIFGCLRPVLSIIGKGVVENKNPQGENKTGSILSIHIK